ncbi:hypothetical protein PIB30_113114, partial [Stylosanthes scabra]|nr:hypothetical protein [Stylosanthes scabra]
VAGVRVKLEFAENHRAERERREREQRLDLPLPHGAGSAVPSPLPTATVNNQASILRIKEVERERLEIGSAAPSRSCTVPSPSHRILPPHVSGDINHHRELLHRRSPL